MGGAVINTEKQSILLREFYCIGLNRGVRLGARKPDVAWQSCALGGSVREWKCGCLEGCGCSCGGLAEFHPVCDTVKKAGTLRCGGGAQLVQHRGGLVAGQADFIRGSVALTHAGSALVGGLGHVLLQRCALTHGLSRCRRRWRQHLANARRRRRRARGRQKYSGLAFLTSGSLKCS